VLLIDLDPLIYACGFAAQISHHTLIVEDGEGNKSVEHTTELAAWKKQHPELAILDKETRIEPAPESTAELILTTTLRDLVARRPYRAFLSGRGNFRDELATIRPYKGNRDKTARPVLYDLLRRLVLDWPGVEYTIGMEADDAISINAHSGAWGDDYTIVSIDKDLDQIPGKHWNYAKDVHYEIDAQAAQDCFVRQWIMGDSTDNVQGVPGMGPKKAAAVLKDMAGIDRQEIHNFVCLMYGDRDACYETARLVWLLRKPTEIWEAEKWIAGMQ